MSMTCLKLFYRITTFYPLDLLSTQHFQRYRISLIRFNSILRDSLKCQSSEHSRMLNKGVINLLGHDNEKQEGTQGAIIACRILCTLLSMRKWTFVEPNYFKISLRMSKEIADKQKHLCFQVLISLSELLCKNLSRKKYKTSYVSKLLLDALYALSLTTLLCH